VLSVADCIEVECPGGEWLPLVRSPVLPFEFKGGSKLLGFRQFGCQVVIRPGEFTENETLRAIAEAPVDPHNRLVRAIRPTHITFENK
jgi:hypothetical protein